MFIFHNEEGDRKDKLTPKMPERRHEGAIKAGEVKNA